VEFDYSKIDKELRVWGKLVNIIMKNAGEKKLRILHKFRKIGIRNTKGLDCSQQWIDRPDGSKLRLRIYKPLVPKKNCPAILYIHGGGYAIRVPESSAKMCKRLIDESGAVIVSPDYRLSCEKPYPAALDDCYLALLWLKNHCDEFGARNDHIMVAGESAGGGLTAAVTILARDKKEVNIAFQMPIYPMIDDRMITESSKNNHAPVWNSYNNRESWRLYLGDLFETENVPYYAAPSRLNDFTGLPPALTFVGDLDPFLDETIQYFENLKNIS